MTLKNHIFRVQFVTKIKTGRTDLGKSETPDPMILP